MAENIRFQSCAISASAGCGKTEEMALRLLGMFLSEPQPENIFHSTMAVTFSRSGAKEIYNRIIELLFDALISNDQRKYLQLVDRLQQLDMGVDNIQPENLMNLLRKLIFAVNDLKICTIDSFMNKIVQSFSTELSLPGRADLVSESEEKILKNNILKKLLVSPEYSLNQMQDDEYEDIALESKKTAYGKNSRKYFTRIQEAIEKYERLLDDNPDAVSYQFRGDVDSIFSLQNRENAWNLLKQHPGKYIHAVTSSKESLYKVLEKICYASVETRFNSAELSRLRDFYPLWEDIKNGSKISATGFARDKFDANERISLILLLQYASYILLQQNAVRSDGFMQLARAYRKAYAGTFFKQGKLTFADLPRLLGNENNNWTYDIAYRLNNRFSHYLIDEFQDTSRIQWQVLAAIFGTPSGDENKSLFIVGDVKQAIYGWRSGDRRLMGKITARMKEQINLQEKPLDVSYRYGHNICMALNTIFAGISIANAGFFPGAGNAWKKIFKYHSPAMNLQYRSKFEAYLPFTDDKNSLCHNAANLILDRIREFNIIENRSSCAILVRGNAEGINLLNELRQNDEYGSFFMWEGNDKIDSSKIITALLHLLIYIQHPADTMAGEIASMLKNIHFLIPRTPEALEREKNILFHSGFYEYLKNCIDKLKKKNTSGAISFCELESIELFLNAAQEFDMSTLPRDSRIFKEYIANIKHSSEAIGYKIRIMTIHHSKGLTFDHVFTVFFNDKSIINREKNISLAGSFADKTKWLLHSVHEEFSIFPEINAAWNEVTAEQAFEKICLMYVALSRAKYTMTLILPPLSSEKQDLLRNNMPLNTAKSSYYLTDYITEQLFAGNDFSEIKDCGYDMLYRMEFDNDKIPLPVIRKKTVPPQNIYPVNFTASAGDSIRRRRIRPSDGMDENENNDKKLFFSLPDEKKGKSFGEKLHRILCSIDDFSNIPELPDADAEIRLEIDKISSNPKICTLLNDYDECWKERSFDVIINNYYISGCFDRVQIKYNPDGSPCSARIIDYKSGLHNPDDVTKLNRYHKQLNTYRQALSQLLHLPVTQIECFIIWTADAIPEKINP